MSEDTLDIVALAVETLAVSDPDLAVRLWWNNRLDAAPFEISPDRVGIIRFVCKQRPGLPFGQIDQRFISLAIRRFTWREVEGDGSASGITETVNLTGEPAPRAAKSSSMNPPFPPAAETWARIELESIL